VSETIQKLTSAMAAGDEDAVETFYRQYFDWLYAEARRATRRDESFCLDIVQDAVLRILRNVRAVESETQWRAWMKLVVHTTALDRMRSERRRRTRETVVAGDASMIAECEDETTRQDRIEWLAQQIARFDPQMIAIIEMRYQRGWTLQQVAQSIGLSIATIDGRLRRAFKTLRERAPEDSDD